MKVNQIIEKKLVPGFSITKDYLSNFKRLTYLKSAYYTEFSDFENLIDCKKKYFETSAVQFIIDFTEILTAVEPVRSTHGKKLENNFIESVIKCFDIEKLLKLIEKDNYIHPLIALQYYIIKIEMNPDDANYYYLLRDLFYKNLDMFDREEKCYVFNRMINYCVQQKFDMSFIKEGLEVNKKMLEQNAYSFLESDCMQILTFRNILITCCRLKEMKWLEYFIENYIKTLSPEYRVDMENLSYASLYFGKNEFEKALESISKINHEFFVFKTDLRNLLLKIYYELNHIEQAFSLVDSYKHFLSVTKEISEEVKKVNYFFINFYLKLLKIKSGQSKEQPSYIKSKIEKEENVGNKFWLLEKTDELLK
jgi:hypothetical protein